MSIFNKSQYIWLASVFRDELHKTGGPNYGVDCDSLKITIQNLAEELQNENPYGFDKSRFLHNIYCGENHKENEGCPYNYHNYEWLGI